MNINLDYTKRIPIYEQIVNEIERYVALGIYKENEQIMSIRELAMELGINPNTVKKAYSILESNGVIVSISTKGTFIKKDVLSVRQKKVVKYINDIKSIMLELNKIGISNDDILEMLNEKNI